MPTSAAWRSIVSRRPGGRTPPWPSRRLTLDQDVQVRSAALEALALHPGDVVPHTLLQAFDQSPHPWVRQQLMLVAAKVPGVSTAEIQKRYETEKDPEAKEGLVVALAQRGDPAGQEEFIRGLHGGEGSRPGSLPGLCRSDQGEMAAATALTDSGR